MGIINSNYLNASLIKSQNELVKEFRREKGKGKRVS